MDTRPELRPTLTRRVIDRVPSNKSWIAKRPNKPAISARIATAANVNSATAQDARVIEARPAPLPRPSNNESAMFTCRLRVQGDVRSIKGMVISPNGSASMLGMVRPIQKGT